MIHSDEPHPARFIEPGRAVSESGQIVYAWPPEGRFTGVWQRVVRAFPDEEERLEALSLMIRWRDENSQLVAFTDDAGEWIDVAWPWDEDEAV